MIDGKPVGQVLSGMREDAARGTTPAQTYGADVAKQNIAERGPQAAIEDYFNRNRLDAQRAPMPTEPGSMAERRAAEGRSLMQGPAAPGPAQRAMLNARQSRGERLVQGPAVSAMTINQEGPPAPLSRSGPPVSAMPVEQAGPPLLARQRPESPSIAYTLGQKTRNAPAAYQSAKATAALALAETGVGIRNASKRSKDALNQANAATALTLARGARDFGAGFSGQ